VPRRSEVPRYVVERTFPEGLKLPAPSALPCRRRAREEDVTWVQSLVSEDKRRSLCVYDAPNPEAIRRTAARNDLPVDRITLVRVLDPYFN
jgi:predicted 2-oxoglutarate/Fe(II)-dependent dioxygenase YbiX